MTIKEGVDATACPLPSDSKDNEISLLDQAKRAFELGDYLKVRELTKGLTDSNNAMIATSAQELRRRVSVDPVQIVILFLSLLLFLAVAYVYVID